MTPHWEAATGRSEPVGNLTNGQKSATTGQLDDDLTLAAAAAGFKERSDINVTLSVFPAFRLTALVRLLFKPRTL